MAKQSPCPCRIGCGCGTVARSHRRSPAIACSSSNSSKILTKPIINSPDETYKKNQTRMEQALTDRERLERKRLERLRAVPMTGVRKRMA